MEQTSWKVEPPRAWLTTPVLEAQFDLRRASEGLNLTRLADRPAVGASFLGADLDRLLGPDFAARSELFARGSDLILIVSESAEYPFRTQLYWRVLESVAGGASQSTAIELIVSVQTSLLDSDPSLTVQSRLAAEQCERLVDARLSPVRAPATLEAPSGSGCFTMRLHGEAPAGYIEMVHPADFESAQISELEGKLVLSNRLFARRLEKGVILRSRIRAVLTTAPLTAESIAALYAAFANSEPPLTV